MSRIGSALAVFLLCLTGFGATELCAGDDMGGPISIYSARLGPQDHFNSHGARLKSAAAIIRQDRANYHKFGLRDPEDQTDSYFSSKQNRALMEQMLSRGSASKQTISRIVNGQPLIHVRVYRDYIDITVE